MASSTSPPYQSPLALRPLAVSRLNCDHAIQDLYRRNFALFTRLQACPLRRPRLPVRKLVSGGALWRPADQRLHREPAGRRWEPRCRCNPLPGAHEIYWSGWVCLPVTTAVFFQAAVDVAAGTNPSFGHVVARTVRRYWGIVLLMLVYLVGLVPSITCVLIPLSIWLLVRWVAAFPAMFAEGAGAIKAVERSTFLTANRWWSPGGTVLEVPGHGGVVSSQAVPGQGWGLSFRASLPGTRKPPLSLIATLRGIGGGSSRDPFAIIASRFMYFDLRVRREALEPTFPCGQWMLAPQSPLA